jgi:predicted ArsR family transcriptional regulator
MERFRGLLPGTVEVISESEWGESPASSAREATDADVLSLLSRRPCTAQDVAEGLGIHVTEALKHLQVLIAWGKVNTVLTGGRHFYTRKGSEEASRL